MAKKETSLTDKVRQILSKKKKPLSAWQKHVSQYLRSKGKRNIFALTDAEKAEMKRTYKK